MMGRRRLTPEEKEEKQKAEKAEAKKRKHSGLSPKELMAAIIDEDALRKRKESQVSKTVTKKAVLKVIQENHWWENQIKVSDFIVVSSGSKFYAQLPSWKSNIWIGEYSSKEELMKVLEDYSKSTCAESKYKPPVPNLHSIIKDIHATNTQ